jgi:hypothetical protein
MKSSMLMCGGERPSGAWRMAIATGVCWCWRMALLEVALRLVGSRPGASDSLVGFDQGVDLLRVDARHQVL